VNNGGGEIKNLLNSWVGRRNAVQSMAQLENLREVVTRVEKDRHNSMI